jgi:hypothetical protein
MADPFHGSLAILYLSPGAGDAVPLFNLTEYSIELDADVQDASALGTLWGSSVKGINRWSGSAAGNFDTGSRTVWLAATSPLAQKLYVYPLASDPTRYYYGMAFIRLNRVLAGGVTAKASVGFSFTGQGPLGEKG